MPVQDAAQLTLSIDPNHDLTNRIARYAGAARIHSERVTKATEDIRERLYYEQVCEEHNLEEQDRFALGFDAAILREKRGEYSPFTPSPENDMSRPEFWRKMYLDTREALSKAQQEYKELLARFHEERKYASKLSQELQERKERERKEDEEFAYWCDQMENELTELLHGPDIFPQGR